MPIRDGKRVGWKHHVEEFNGIVIDDDLTVVERLVKIANLIELRSAAFGEDADMWAEHLRHLSAGDEAEAENEGQHLLHMIYDYADEHLVWLGT